MKRPFGESLRELVESVQPAGVDAEQVRVVGVYFDLPLEVQMRGKGDQAEFLGDVPNWRWRTVFDLPPGRIRVHCHLGDSL
jgi:hypothetical protein